MKNQDTIEKSQLEHCIGRATCIKVSRNKYVGVYGATKVLDQDRLMRISEGAILFKIDRNED